LIGWPGLIEEGSLLGRTLGTANDNAALSAELNPGSILRVHGHIGEQSQTNQGSRTLLRHAAS
jgi:hypothetical protein